MNSDFPLVSIITPAYNRASYLVEVIDSVLGQDYPNLEYIVVDDGSTDNTSEVLEKYTGRITWEKHPNMGETRTNNKGWSMARGEIIATVNSDDPLLPGAVSAAVDFMQSNPEILVAYPDWNMIGPKGELIQHIEVAEYNHLYMLRKHDCSVGPGAFFRRKAFELTEMRDPSFRYVADFEYWLRLGLFGPFARIPKTLATFRVHPDSASVSHAGELMAAEHITLIENFYSQPTLTSEIIAVKNEAYASAYYVAGTSLGLQPTKLKRQYYRKALAFSPLSQIARYPGRLFVMMPAFLGIPFRHTKTRVERFKNPRSWFVK